MSTGIKKDNTGLSNLGKDLNRPSTPPPKAQAFEDFKVERGSEINRIWNENKDILTSKRRQYSDLAHKINETKTHIDATRLETENKRAERLAMGEFLSEEGETVIDEEEFGLIKRLQDLKSRYREDFEKWKELKSEIVYCQNLVEQCRQKLIQEFDIWYNEVYFNGQIPKTSENMQYEQKYGSAATRQYEDAIEKFERMQREIMSNDIESIPYHAAKLRNDRKHVYENSLEMANHHYLSGHSQNVGPGTPQRRLANPPPGKLRVS